MQRKRRRREEAMAMVENASDRVCILKFTLHSMKHSRNAVKARQ